MLLWLECHAHKRDLVVTVDLKLNVERKNITATKMGDLTLVSNTRIS